MKSPDDPCRITTSWSESTVALTLERSLTVFQKSRLSFSASVTPVTFNSRREFSETPRRIRPPSELANALYVSHRLSGNLSLAFFASIQLSSRSSLTSDSERPAKEINSITSEFATLYAFPPVYRHFIRLSASLPPLYTPFRQFFILGKPSHVRAASPITMFGRPRWSGPGRRFRYDFPALSSMIRGCCRRERGRPMTADRNQAGYTVFLFNRKLRF